MDRDDVLSFYFPEVGNEEQWIGHLITCSFSLENLALAVGGREDSGLDGSLF